MSKDMDLQPQGLGLRVSDAHNSNSVSSHLACMCHSLDSLSQLLTLKSGRTNMAAKVTCLARLYHPDSIIRKPYILETQHPLC